MDRDEAQLRMPVLINVSLEATFGASYSASLFPVDPMATIGRRRNILNLLLPTVAGAGLEDVWVGGAVHPFRCLSKLEVSDWSLRGISDNNHDALVSAARPAGQQEKLSFIRARLVQDASNMVISPPQRCAFLMLK
jgi:hypothetical protein